MKDTTPSPSKPALSPSDPSSVRPWLASNHPKQLSLLDRFELELRLGRLSSSANPLLGHERLLITSSIVELLRNLVGSTRWRNGAQLMALLRGLGMELQAAGGSREPAIGNVVRRIMCAVRDEIASGGAVAGDDDGEGGSDKGMDSVDELSEKLSGIGMPPSQSMKPRGGGGGGQLSLAGMLYAHPQHVTVKTRSTSGKSSQDRRAVRSDSSSSLDDARTDGDDRDFPPEFYANRPELRGSVMEAIQEITSDLEDLQKNIDDQASAYLLAGEVILTYARSKTVESFLKAAATKKRRFQVIVCEGAPHFGGHAMARSLAYVGIDTTVINDAAAFAIMSRVNKVLLPAHAVLANGGLIAPSGSNMVALAARENSVPVLCVTGMFKLCPMYPHAGQDTLNNLVSPSCVVDYTEMSDPVMSEVEFVNPVHDYIPPQLVDLYVTNIGGFQPSYIYRLLAEYYHIDDWESFDQMPM